MLEVRERERETEANKREVLKKSRGGAGNCASKCPTPLLELFNY